MPVDVLENLKERGDYLLPPSDGLRNKVLGKRAAEQPLGANWRQSFNRLKYISASLEDLGNVPDSYKYVEVTSLTGWQAAKWFLRAAKFDDEGLCDLVAMARSHRAMLKNIPDSRAQQEVVSTALEILGGFWDTNSNERDNLQRTIDSGFILAKARHNSIFYTQMLLARAMFNWRNGQMRLAIAFTIMAASAMKSQELSLDHEGIGQLRVFAEAKCAPFAALLIIVLGWTATVQYKEKVEDLLRAGIDRPTAQAGATLGIEWLNSTHDFGYLYDVAPGLFAE
jgi:hypothetical protein